MVPFSASAQYKWDFGGTIGPANYVGEIGGLDKDARPSVIDMKFKSTRYSFGGFARRKIAPKFSLKTSLNYIRISGADSNSVIPGRTGRNLSFRNDMFELAITPEFYFYQVQDFARIGRKTRVDFRSYLFTGVSVFYSNPKARLDYNDKNSEWVALQPLKTEGQVKPYSRIGVAIPVGIGMDYTLSRDKRFGFEISFRKTFTDYLDDVSTVYADTGMFLDPIAKKLSNRRPEIPAYREGEVAVEQQYFSGEKRGDPGSKDYYIMAQFTYSYVIKGKSSFYKSRYNYLTGAKRRFKKKRTRLKF